MKYFVKKVNNEVALIKNGKSQIITYESLMDEFFKDMHLSYAIVDCYELRDNVLVINKVDYYTGDRYMDEVYLDPKLLEDERFMECLNSHLKNQQTSIYYSNMSAKEKYYNGSFSALVESLTYGLRDDYNFNVSTDGIKSEEVAVKVRERFMNPNDYFWNEMKLRLKKIYRSCSDEFSKTTRAFVTSRNFSIVASILSGIVLMYAPIKSEDFIEYGSATVVGIFASILTGYFANKSFDKETDKALAHIADSVASVYTCDINPDEIFKENVNRTDTVKLTK